LPPNRPLNLLANYLSTGWTALIQLLLVPVYIRLLGVESYGLVGLYLTVQAVLQVLDLGLSPALNRELARRTAVAGPLAGTADLVRTLEIITWLIGLTLGLAIAAASSFIAHHWVHSHALPPDQVARAVALMGLSVALQWPISFYSGGLLGLQRQSLTALVNVATVTLFAVGVLALLYPTRSVQVFFVWRAFTALVGVLALRRLLWASLRPRCPQEPPRFTRASLQGIWRFSLGMTGIAATAMLLTQVDKVVLSRMLPLDRFGYYALASAVATLLPQLVAPLHTAFFPRLAQAAVTGDRAGERQAFHLSAQLIALIVHPAAITLCLYAGDLLLLWTGNPEVARTAAGVLSLLALGALLNSVMVPLYTLQIASGWTRLSVGINLALVVVTVPWSIFATARWGLLGAASTPVVLNGLYLLLGAPLTFRRLLVGQGTIWLRRDVLVPLICTAAASAPLLLLSADGRFTLLARLALAAAAAYLAAFLSVPDARRRVLQLLAARKAAWTSKA
jgi:O-antigen/teichoic acid export membrane protein